MSNTQDELRKQIRLYIYEDAMAYDVDDITDEAMAAIEAYKDKACKKAFDDGYKMGIEFGKSVGKTAERTNLKSEENKHE